MLFHRIPIDALTVDPIATPASVPRTHVWETPRTVAPSSDSPVQFVLTTGGGATPAGAPVIEIYAEIEVSEVPTMSGEYSDMSNRKWTLIESITVTTGEVVYSTERPLPGKTYFRVTTNATVGGKLDVAVVG